MKGGTLLASNFAAGQLPAGAKGERGEPGLKGEPGKKDEPVNANVIYSRWQTATESSPTVYAGTWVATATISAPSLTSADLEVTSVEVDVKFEPSTILPLPYRSDAGGKFNTLSFMLSKENITLRRTTDGSNEEGCLVPFAPALEYRYVITPGNMKAS